MEAQELTKVEELQETLAEDSGPGQHGRGKRAAEDLQVGMPVKKRMKKAVIKMELQVESSQEGGMDNAALDEGDRETRGVPGEDIRGKHCWLITFHPDGQLANWRLADLVKQLTANS